MKEFQKCRREETLRLLLAQKKLQNCSLIFAKRRNKEKKPQFFHALSNIYRAQSACVKT